VAEFGFLGVTDELERRTAMISLKRYGWLCVLGGEVAYVGCLAGGYLPLRTSRAMELHRTLFETLPGFVWGTVSGVFLGAVYVFAFAWIFAWYFVWMYNTSQVSKEK
jgi:hypothetical protein